MEKSVKNSKSEKIEKKELKDVQQKLSTEEMLQSLMLRSQKEMTKDFKSGKWLDYVESEIS